MASRIFDVDGFTRSRRIWHENYDGDVVIETDTDVTEALKDAERANNAHTQGRKSRWSDSLTGNRVASIPLVIYMQLEREGILADPDRFKAWLNDPDNSAWRCRPGKL